MKRQKSREPWREYCLYPDHMTPGNEVRLLVNGTQAFPAMLESISLAQKTILMDSYIFNNDQIGSEFSDKLRQKSREGVLVHLIVDAMGTMNVSNEYFTAMRQDGVNVLEYHPMRPWHREFGILRRNHRKLLVVDGKIGFVGGLNIGDEWVDVASGGKGWHDIHVRIEGPAVRELSKLHLSTWRKHEKVELNTALHLPISDAVGNTLAAVVGSKERRQRKRIRRSYYHAIKRAQKYIFIANAYFLPDLGFRRALRNAVSRGVDVRVMIPASGDIFPVQMASQALYSSLLRNGIQLYLWKEAVLHAKTAVIDDQWSTVGSFNLDRRSWAMNLEVNVNIVGSNFARKLSEVFVRDQAHCEVLSSAKWATRSWFQKLVEKFFFLFRKFM